jgi:IMP dehydrogenase
MADVDIGLGKSARRAYALDEVALVPTRRTRAPELVDLRWELDAFTFDLPFMAAPVDGIVGPESAAEIGRHGGVAVLDLEGLWTRHEDAGAQLAKLEALPDADALARLRELFAAPVRPELVRDRIRDIRAAGVVSCGAVTPQRTVDLADVLVAAELDLLVIHGTVVSAEHVTHDDEPLNLKTFVRRLDIPVVVGGCTSYKAALHLMRTGAAGVLVGSAGTSDELSRQVLGLGIPQATAIADARAARMRHLDETGVYVHVIAAGPLATGGDMAKAIACGADGILLGPPLAAASGLPGHGVWWAQTATHERVPRGGISRTEPLGTLAEVLTGPATEGAGRTNLFGALRSAMAMSGFETLKELQKAELVTIT